MLDGGEAVALEGIAQEEVEVFGMGFGELGTFGHGYGMDLSLVVEQGVVGLEEGDGADEDPYSAIGTVGCGDRGGDIFGLALEDGFGLGEGVPRFHRLMMRG